MDQIVYIGEGQFGHYKVVDRIYNDRPARLLLAGEKAAPQSGIALDNNPELLFDYNQRLFEVATSLMPQSTLVIGGGAFTLPTAIVERLQGTRVDAVEIDPFLQRIAQKYFDLPRSRKIKIINSDGRNYIDKCTHQYDLIVIDAFSEYDIPSSLLTVEAAAQYARLLSANGTLALNIIAKYRGSLPTLTHKLIASLRQSFQTIEVYPADPQDSQDHEQNLIVVASLAHSLSLDYLQSVQVYPEKLNEQPLQMHDSDI